MVQLRGICTLRVASCVFPWKLQSEQELCLIVASFSFVKVIIKAKIFLLFLIGFGCGMVQCCAHILKSQSLVYLMKDCNERKNFSALKNTWRISHKFQGIQGDPKSLLLYTPAGDPQMYQKVSGGEERGLFKIELAWGAWVA